MKFPVIRTRAGQYSWLQALSLVIATVAYFVDSMTVFVVMLIVGTLFGVLAFVMRLQQAKLIQQSARGRRRK